MIEKIIATAIKNGVTDANIISADIYFQPLKTDNYPQNLKKYLDNPKRKNIKEFFKDAKSVLVCIYQYWHKTINYNKILKNIKEPYTYLSKKYKNMEYIKEIKNKDFKIARYALVDEYHIKIKENLKRIFKDISILIPDLKGKIFVDSSPVIEKQLGVISGLGFQTRNTLLTSTEYGSFIFIGGIALNIEIKNKNNNNTSTDICKNCKICEEICPTKALKDFKLNPEKCISYWTTHTDRKNIPKDIITKSNYIFGCDICQEICPLNDYAKIDKNGIFLKKLVND